ncbi:MAG: alpha/beta fold hydrolase [Ferruginibacter sp.]
MKQWMILVFSSITFYAGAQSFKGTWEGRLQAGTSLRIVFIFTEKEGKISATFQSPDQTKAILPTDTCYSIKDSIYVISKRFGISFRGQLTNDTSINGVFSQGADFSLPLKKVVAISTLKRPQAPKPPFPYLEEEVIFENKSAGIQLVGTLSYPKPLPNVDYLKVPTYPAVILITGSGPQDRDETLFEHKPFAVIADYLTKKGFAVLRYDERGVGKSTGKFQESTTADFANDTEAAFDFLKSQSQIDTAHIGLIGHSEGGMIAPMLAARRNDIAFIVMLAGPGTPTPELMQEQIEAVLLSQGGDSALAAIGGSFFKKMAKAVNSSKDTSILFTNALAIANEWSIQQPDSILTMMNMENVAERAIAVRNQLKPMMTPWFRYFLSIDPGVYLSKLSCKVMALNGDKDIQVVALSNLKAIKTALQKSKSTQYDIISLPGLNHLFQSCKTCTTAEYGELEETFSPIVLQKMGEWLLLHGR